VPVAGARPWEDYHIYGFQSDPTNITFYLDGVQTLRCATPKDYLTCGLDLRLEYALGGGWPLTNVVANSHYDLDWVRVWALPSPNRIPLNVSYATSHVTLTWTNPVFQLQSATNVSGPYTEVLGATNPYTAPLSGTQKFYRLIWDGQ
jgi:beta-glucanase (GH16 family)